MTTKITTTKKWQMLTVAAILMAGAVVLQPRAVVASRPLASVGLGCSAAAIVALKGHPDRIDFGPEIQTWFYLDPSGTLKARYVINQGILVRVE